MNRISRILTGQISQKILFTVFILAIYRLLAAIPLPGVNMDIYQAQFGKVSSSEANLLISIFTGGQLETPSIVGLGIGIYITASIIMQLLSYVIPKLEELTKEGARGQQLIDQYTRYTTVPLSFIYGIGYMLLLSQQPLQDAAGNLGFLIPRTDTGAVSPTNILFMALVLTAGSMIIMWLAEQITEKGVGNGASIILTIGILSSLPARIIAQLTDVGFSDSIQAIFSGDLSRLSDPGITIVLSLIIGGIVMVTAIVFVNESIRKVAIQYASRVRIGSQESHLPLKLNQTGVLPVIFASSLLTTPTIIISLLQNIVPADSPFYATILSIQQSDFFLAGSSTYNIVYFTLIVFFTIFYVFIVFKPETVAENLQKSGAFIPGIRPGKSTESYLTRILMRLGSVGAVYLGVIALIPIFAGNALTASGIPDYGVFSAIGGTTILIIVSVALDTYRQVDSMRASQNYDRYL